MGTNLFFRNSDYSPEQNLLDDLAEEMIKMFGVDVYYIPRTTGYVDPLFTEAPSSKFEAAIPIEMYLNSYSGFQGEGDLMTKFGLTIADKLTLSVSRNRFYEDIGIPYTLKRPNEGDLIYFPYTKGMFEIRYVEHEASFYQTGALQYFELQLEKFNYSSEIFSTGLAEVDSVMRDNSVADDNFALLTEDVYTLQTEDGYGLTNETYDIDDIMPGAQNIEFETFSDSFIDFSKTNPFGDQ